MITDRNLKFLRKTVEDGRWLCSHPFEWDATLKRPVLSKSKWRLWGWYFCFSYTALYWFFVVVRCYQMSKSSTADTAIKVFATTMTVYIGLGFVLQIFVACSLVVFPRFGYTFFTYKSVIEGESELVEDSADARKQMKFAEAVVVWGYYMIWSNTGTYIMWAVVQPEAPHLLSSISDNPGIVLRVTSVIAWAYLYAAYASASTICFCNAFTWVSSTIALLKKLQDLDFLEEQKANMPRIIGVYRLLQLQAEDFGKGFGVANAGSKLCLTLFACATTYGAIRLKGLASFVMFMVGSSSTAILFLLLSVWAELNSSSGDFMDNCVQLMGRHPELGTRGTWLRKSVKSLQTMKVRMFGFYMIDKLNALDVISYIADNVVFLLVEY